LFSIIAYANDTTIIIERPIPITKLGADYFNERFGLNGKVVYFPYSRSEKISLFSYLLIDDLSTPIEIRFSNCSFIKNDNYPRVIQQKNINKFLSFDSCTFDYIYLKNLSGSLGLERNNIHFLEIDSSRGLNLGFLDNMQVDSPYIKISNSFITELSFVQRLSKNTFLFNNDTINNTVWLPSSNLYIKDREVYPDVYSTDSNLLTEERELDTPIESTINFKNCYINADFACYGLLTNSTIVFEDCTFGPNADLANMIINKIVIKNCRVTNPLLLSFNLNYPKVWLSIANTDLTNIKLDYSSNVGLSFEPTDNSDVVLNTYKNLLDKFRSEGKDESYKNVDIQYKLYKKSSVGIFLERIWWYYGYRKYYVFGWTIFFLSLFFLFNASYWTGMQATYPIVPLPKINYYDRGFKSNVRKLTTALLFTIFIFFSIGINFSKLNYNKLRFVIAFFLQYLIGLFCLVFILKAIIKF
jgi:hypothetical protein